MISLAEVIPKVLVPQATRPDKPEGFRWGSAGASLTTRERTSAGKTLRGRLYKPRVSPPPKDISPSCLSDKIIYKLYYKEESLRPLRNSL